MAVLAVQVMAVVKVLQKLTGMCSRSHQQGYEGLLDPDCQVRYKCTLRYKFGEYKDLQLVQLDTSTTHEDAAKC